MSENLTKKPSKSILKTSNSVERPDGPSTSRGSKEQRFDEMNIMATLHPADKDYGHMKIVEPKTPFEESSDANLNPTDQLDANLLSAKLTASLNRPSKDYESSDSEEELPETPEETAHRKEFEKKRKMHYNEFQAIQRARQLLEQDEDEDDNDDCNDGCKDTSKSKVAHIERGPVDQNKASSSKRPFKPKTKP